MADPRESKAEATRSFMTLEVTHVISTISSWLHRSVLATVGEDDLLVNTRRLGSLGAISEADYYTKCSINILMNKLMIKW